MKSYDKPGSILKSRDIILPTKVYLVKAEVFLVVTYGCESWTIKKAECQRIDAFELWCWRRLFLRVPRTARRLNQSILKEISLEYSLEGLMLKLQYFATWCEELTHWKRPWCWERLKAGGEGDNRGWDGWIASPDSMDMSLSKLSWWWTGKPGVLQSMELDTTERLNWTDWEEQQINILWVSVPENVRPSGWTELRKEFCIWEDRKACVTAAEEVGASWGGQVWERTL